MVKASDLHACPLQVWTLGSRGQSFPLLQWIRITPFVGLQQVGGAADPEGAAVDDMGVDHGGVQITAAHQLLDGSDVLAAFEQVSGKAMAQGVWRGRLMDPSCQHGLTHGLLDQAGIQMVSALLFGFGVAPALVLGEHPLPPPLHWC